jgi:hypothetical protein
MIVDGSGQEGFLPIGFGRLASNELLLIDIGTVRTVKITRPNMSGKVTVTDRSVAVAPMIITIETDYRVLAILS